MRTFPFLQKRNLNDGTGSANGSHALIDLQNIDKLYKSAAGDFPALKKINLQIWELFWSSLRLLPLCQRAAQSASVCATAWPMLDLNLEIVQ
jgi:hypothetical protein